MKTLCIVAVVLSTAANAAIEVSVPEAVSVVAIRARVGSSFSRADDERHQLPPGSLEKVVRAAAEKALAGCDGARVVLSDEEAPDNLGGSSSRLRGVGLYANLPQTGVAAGRWFIAPFVALRVKVARADGKVVMDSVVQEHSITYFENPSLTAKDFMGLPAQRVLEVAAPFITSTLDAAFRKGAADCSR